MSDRPSDVRKTYKLLINGAFPRSESGRSYEVTWPKGEFLANVAQGSRKDIRDAVVAARGAQAKWWNATAYNRGQVIYRLAEMAESRRDELAEHVGLAEGLKPKAAREDRLGAIDRMVWYAGWTDKIAQVSGGPIPSPDRSSTSRFRCRAASSACWQRSSRRSKDLSTRCWRRSASAIRSSRLASETSTDPGGAAWAR